MNRDDIARLLVKSVAYYNRQSTLKAVPPLQSEAIRELHSFGVLSMAAMAAIVGCTEYRVEKVIKGTTHPSARGRLNPDHIPWLAYALSTQKLNNDTLRSMLKNGTSLSTIEDLTGIPRATLNRWRKQ